MSAEPPHDRQSRREFLAKTTGALVVLGAACEVGELRSSTGATPTSLDVDVALPAFAALATAGGAAAVDAGTKRLLLLRVSETDLVALDRLCTHQACDLDPAQAGRYDARAGLITCRCHNARFDTG